MIQTRSRTKQSLFLKMQIQPRALQGTTVWVALYFVPGVLRMKNILGRLHRPAARRRRHRWKETLTYAQGLKSLTYRRLRQAHDLLRGAAMIHGKTSGRVRLAIAVKRGATGKRVEILIVNATAVSVV